MSNLLQETYLREIALAPNKYQDIIHEIEAVFAGKQVVEQTPFGYFILTNRAVFILDKHTDKLIISVPYIIELKPSFVQFYKLIKLIAGDAKQKIDDGPNGIGQCLFIEIPLDIALVNKVKRPLDVLYKTVMQTNN